MYCSISCRLWYNVHLRVGASPRACITFVPEAVENVSASYTCVIVELLLCNVRNGLISNLGVKLWVPQYPSCYRTQGTGAAANFVEDVPRVHCWSYYVLTVPEYIAALRSNCMGGAVVGRRAG